MSIGVRFFYNLGVYPIGGGGVTVIPDLDQVLHEGNSSSLGITVGASTFDGNITVVGMGIFTPTGAAYQNGVLSIATTNSGDVVYASGGDFTYINAGTGTIGSGYGLRINVQNTGSGTITDGIGIKVNDAVVSAGQIVNQSGIFIGVQSQGSGSNTGINLLGLNDQGSVSWSTGTNVPQIRISQTRANALMFTLNNLGISQNPATFQKLSIGGNVSSTSLGIAQYISTTITATQNNAALSGLYIAPTYIDGGFTGVLHYNIYAPTAAINYLNGSLLTGGLNIAGASLTFLENTGQFYTGWNYSAGDGETDFIANRGGGSAGGYAWYDITNAGVITQMMRLTTAGLVIPGAITAGSGIPKVFQGRATLVAGTLVVSDANVRTGDTIFITLNTPAGSVSTYCAPVASIVNATSFTINAEIISAGLPAVNILDTSVVNYLYIH